MSKYPHFFGVAMLLASLASCGASSSALSSYSVTETLDLGTCAVYQISEAFSPKAFASVEVTPGWRFDGLPLFFESGCPLGKDALLSVASSDGLSENAESSAYVCQGTSFLSYTSRKSADGTPMTFAISGSGQERLAIFYVARLRKKVFAPASGGGTAAFSLYEALEAPYLDCRAA
jgi:hypothetical protein